MGDFVGGRIVPKHCGVWSKNSKYEMLSIVYQPETGDSYISRKSVPAGTLLDSAEYWAICAEYQQQCGFHPHRGLAEVRGREGAGHRFRL